MECFLSIKNTKDVCVCVCMTILCKNVEAKYDCNVVMGVLLSLVQFLFYFIEYALTQLILFVHYLEGRGVSDRREGGRERERGREGGRRSIIH